MKANWKYRKMKLASLILSLLVAATFAPSVRAEEPVCAEDNEGPVERKVTAAPDVVVELSLESGDVVVQGWDRQEVRAFSQDATRIELRSTADAPTAPTKPVEGTPSKPAAQSPVRRVSVLVGVGEDDDPLPDEFGTGNVELNVPRGATVILHIQSGDTNVSDVAEARIDSASGDVDVSRVSRALDVSCFSGNVHVDDASGPVRLRSLSGEVTALKVRPLSARDDLQVNSTSGNITLEDVAHTKVVGKTVSGNVSLEGALISGGTYDLRTTNGDVTLTLPADSSFRINARVVTGGEIITDFPIKAAALPPPPRHDMQTRLTGTVGKGDADINLSSFNGTVHLRKM